MTSCFVCATLNLGRKKSTGTEPNHGAVRGWTRLILEVTGQKVKVTMGIIEYCGVRGYAFALRCYIFDKCKEFNLIGHTLSLSLSLSLSQSSLMNRWVHCRCFVYLHATRALHIWIKVMFVICLLHGRFHFHSNWFTSNCIKAIKQVD